MRRSATSFSRPSPSGRPVVVRNLGRFPELVAESGGGLVFDSPDGLVAALGKLASDDELAADSRREWIRARHGVWSESAHLDRYFALIEEHRSTATAYDATQRSSRPRLPSGAGSRFCSPRRPSNPFSKGGARPAGQGTNQDLLSGRVGTVHHVFFSRAGHCAAWISSSLTSRANRAPTELGDVGEPRAISRLPLFLAGRKLVQRVGHHGRVGGVEVPGGVTAGFDQGTVAQGDDRTAAGQGFDNREAKPP